MTSNSQPPLDPPPATIDFGGEEQAERLVAILDGYLAELKAGRRPDRAALLAEHPELADQLAACLAGLEFIQGVESTTGGGAGETSPPARRLGDFRILREVGRGGMGAVYEAEQVSLGRRVALKVLRFGGVSDPEALDRFRREAETVARLHHTNIVPIFAVGSDQGVNYYAMQFIEGRSLAEVRTEADPPLDPLKVADWGLQAAEALAHAHDRNVIHRDVKPSNLLLDAENRIWLTDFGLARRLDDVTLSMTGALLGTPRYMSPEQASAARRQVDRRTDVYSLGATLYELLAGRPAFSGDTPHHVIQQILSTDPTPLRKLRPDLPRDLETVVMKCLAKEPSSRYGTARELADDLRACVEQRPIRARRAGPVEQAVRWLRGRRQGARIAAGAVAATLLLVVLGTLAGRWYDGWRRAELQLLTPDPPLTVELLDARGESMEVATAPTERPIEARDGEYALRASSEERWSRTWRLTLNRGDEVKREIDLQDQQLWAPSPVARSWSTVDDDQGAALLLWTERGVVCESGAPKRTRWQAPLLDPRPAGLDAAAGLVWPWFDGESAHDVPGPTGLAPVPAASTVDVNGDGRGDFVFAARHQAFVATLSGLDGAVLWCAPLAHEVRRPPTPHEGDREVRSRTVGEPLWTADADDDGVPDLAIGWFDTSADPGPLASTGGAASAERWIELLSGATGRSLWKRPLAASDFELGETDVVPPAFRRPVGRGAGSSSGLSGGSLTLRRHYIRLGRHHVERHGTFVYAPEPLRRLTIDGRERLALVAGRRIAWIDPRTGEPAQEALLPATPDRPGEWADVDGDGAPEFIHLVKEPGTSPTPATSGSSGRAKATVWSLRERRALWSKTLAAVLPRQEIWTQPAPEWPVVADLDGDGKAEVIAPDGTSLVAGPRTFVEVPWSDVTVFEGATGAVRWRRSVVTVDQQIDRLAVGPDVDGDGHREVYSAALANLPMRLYVEARSGRTGELLWLTPQRVRVEASLTDRHIGPLRWWNAGEDGWPQLLATVQSESTTPIENDVLAFSAATGRVTRKRKQTAELRTADVDRDGVEDLIGYRATDLAYPEDGGTIDCVRGVASEPWNRLGPEGAPAADFNDDGVRDLLRSFQLDRLEAVCGRTGSLLWRVKLGGPHGFEAAPLWSPPDAEPDARPADAEAMRRADFDGDGTVDVLYWLGRHFMPASPMLGVVSGRTGEILWKTHELTVRVAEGLVDFQVADVDRDGAPELAAIVKADVDYDPSRRTHGSEDLQAWLVVVSGRDGAVRWRTPLSAAYGGGAPATAKRPPGGATSYPLRSHGRLCRLLAVADLDGDGTLDFLAPAVADDAVRLEFRAFRGSDGSPLWKHALPAEWQLQHALLLQHPPQVGDLDGDGRPEVVLLERDRAPIAQPSNDYLPVLRALDGATGKSLWTVPGPRQPYEYEAFFEGERRGVSNVLLARTARGGRIPLVIFTGTEPRMLTIADPKQPQWTPLPGLLMAASPRLCDVEGDGADEVAFVLGGVLRLLSPERPADARWTFGAESAPLTRIVDVRDGDSRRSGRIVVRRTKGDNGLVGLDAASGRPRWFCAGPAFRERQSYVAPQISTSLDLDPAAAAPYVLFQHDQTTYCRRAVVARVGEEAVEPGMRQRQATEREFASVSRPVASWSQAAPNDTLRPLAVRDDPRWARHVPWVRHMGDSLELLRFLSEQALRATALLILPVAYVGWMIGRRRWSLQAMFGLTLVAVLAVVVAMLNPGGDDDEPVGERWSRALFAAPPLVLLMRLAIWPLVGRWRTSLAWIGVALAAAALLGGAQLAVDHWTTPLLPDEYYISDEWYAIVEVGFYLTSWIALPAVAVQNWRRRRRMKVAAA